MSSTTYYNKTRVGQKGQNEKKKPETRVNKGK